MSSVSLREKIAFSYITMIVREYSKMAVSIKMREKMCIS